MLQLVREDLSRGFDQSGVGCTCGITSTGTYAFVGQSGCHSGQTRIGCFLCFLNLGVGVEVAGDALAFITSAFFFIFG